ncbi:MAG: chemotaxis protein CheW [Brevinemataceae bacterium]
MSEIQNEHSQNIYQKDSVLFHTITFRVLKQPYAVDILYIRDIVMEKQIFRVPNSHPALLGVTNLRGEIIPVYSVKKLLGFHEEKIPQNPIQTIIPANDSSYFIILQLKNKLVAISVDQIDKNISATVKNYNEGTYMPKWSKDTVFIGVIMDEKENILVMDAPQLLQYLIKENKEMND